MSLPNQNQKYPKILEFLIFHRNGTCLCDLDTFEENKKSITNKVFTSSANKENEHRYKLIYGMLFSMKSFVKTLSPIKAKDIYGMLFSMKSFVKTLSPIKAKDYLKTFSTSNYKLHYTEFLNGLRFIFISTPTNFELNEYLRKIHNLFYTPLISKNIFCEQEEQIKNEVFLEKVYSYICAINSNKI